MNIGVIGQGFVGNAVFQKFKNYYKVLTYDLQSELCNSTYEKIHQKCDIVFVCLPTPMESDGSCHTGIVEKTLHTINEDCKMDLLDKTVIIKSTIPPGTTAKWNKLFSKLNKSMTLVF